jgi:hypothetical protein
MLLVVGEGYEEREMCAMFIDYNFMNQALENFVRESWKIEGLESVLCDGKIKAKIVSAHSQLVAKPRLTLTGLKRFVESVEPGVEFRNRFGLDVRIGSFYPLSGGPEVEKETKKLLRLISDCRISQFDAHVRYEQIHPFTDCNGRSGRAVWLWMLARSTNSHNELRRGFLHQFYYQTLAYHQLNILNSPR